MGQFLKFTLASLLGIIIAMILGVFIMIGVVASMISSGDQEVVVKENTILKIDLDYPVYDRTTNDPSAFFNGENFNMGGDPGLDDIIKSIELAAADPQIKGIYLSNPSINAGAAQILEIRKALEKFKSSGKFIMAYTTGYDQKGYYLASVADEVYVHPEGTILFKGLSAELMFFKGTLEKLEVEMQVIRHGKFKAAVEPFILDKMSDENREQYTALITSVWNDMLKDISTSRNITMADLNNAANTLALDDPKMALALNFVDGIKYPDEVNGLLRAKTGKADDDELEFLTIDKYIKSAKFNEEPAAKDKIAVIYANGEIKDGKGDDTFIGEQNISGALIKARDDDKVIAVVLRVNSPGGSALVSDLIWREVLLTKAKKPVVVSMGNVAASGGYYISCAADYIYADPTTITGSIGVFGLIPNVGGFMTNKLGITFDEAKTNENSDYITINKKLSPYQEAVIQKSVERVYDGFTTKVAEGRKMSKEAVDQIGQGRVWSGTQALEIGLIDELGGLENAIAKAAELAKIDQYKLKKLPLQKDPFQQIIDDLTGQSTSILMKYYVGEDYKYIEMFKDLENRHVIQARMPFEINIQ